MRLEEDGVFPDQKVSTCIESSDVFVHGKTVKSAQLFDIRISIELQGAICLQMNLVDLSSLGNQL